MRGRTARRVRLRTKVRVFSALIQRCVNGSMAELDGAVISVNGIQGIAMGHTSQGDAGGEESRQ